MAKKKSFAERFGARLGHARDKVMEQEKHKAEKKKEADKKKPPTVHVHDAGAVHVGSGRGAVVGTNARAKPQVVASK